LAIGEILHSHHQQMEQSHRWLLALFRVGKKHFGDDAYRVDSDGFAPWLSERIAALEADVARLTEEGKKLFDWSDVQANIRDSTRELRTEKEGWQGRAEAAEATVRALREKQQWQVARGNPPRPVGDQRKLVWLESQGMAYIGIRVYRADEGCWTVNGEREESATVTHWMDLPERPVLADISLSPEAAK
jgi:hypothetical protein